MIFSVLFNIVIALQANQTPPPAKPKAAPAKPPVTTPALQASNGYIPPAPLPGTVMATVNGVTIKANDVEKLLWDWAGRGILEDLILFELIRERAALDKISVTPAETQKAFDAQMVEIQKQIPPGQDLEAFIREKGFPKSRLFLHIQADLLMTRIVDLKYKPSDYISVSTLVVKPKTATPPADPKLPSQPTAVKPTPSDAELQEAAGRAMDIYNRLKKGEDWDKVLAGTDQTPQIVQSHGALGWRAIEAFPATTKVELKTLKLHEYTKPVQTSNGLQIFRIDGLGVNAEPGALEALKKQYEDRAKQTLAQELQKGAKIVRVFGKPAK